MDINRRMNLMWDDMSCEKCHDPIVKAEKYFAVYTDKTHYYCVDCAAKIFAQKLADENQYLIKFHDDEIL